MDRRCFFIKGAKELVTSLNKSSKELKSISDDLIETINESFEDNFDFFENYENSYSLTLAYPREFFEQIAKKEGIDFQDRDTLDIAKELHNKGFI